MTSGVDGCDDKGVEEAADPDGNGCSSSLSKLSDASKSHKTPQKPACKLARKPAHKPARKPAHCPLCPTPPTCHQHSHPNPPIPEAVSDADCHGCAICDVYWRIYLNNELQTSQSPKNTQEEHASAQPPVSQLTKKQEKQQKYNAKQRDKKRQESNIKYSGETQIRAHVSNSNPNARIRLMRDSTAKKNPSGGLVQHGIGHDCPMLCQTSLSDRLFDPMSDNICPMSFYSSDRLFDSFESVAEQASDEFSWRAGHWPALRAQFASRSLACSRTQFAEQASDLHREMSSPGSLPSRPVTCSRTQFAEQASDLLANSEQASDLHRKLSSPSRPVTCSQTELAEQFAEQASDLHHELSSPSRSLACSQTELAEQVTGLLGELSSPSRSLACSQTQFAEQASDLHRELSSPSRSLACSRIELAKQVIGLLANSVRRAGQ
ncbi:hypothetical protein PCANC_20553 [Puccinia coronata f. sp. avenae]|uniref:Uncharacterized protein n=1 Tax=Puccinia coronata f. sp. avenae TaxID=200324 RepID=A0A2N5SRJ6_9BASI|nr:hypothetical protein PCANC_20553 [Puccinia coronata f. sp. avenae]